jgi:hypothetical protein
MSCDSITARCSRHLHHEALILDEGRWQEWLTNVSRDIDYRVAAENLRWEDGVGRWSTGPEIVRDDYLTLETRVRRIETKTAWAENPRTRTRRIVGNILVEDSDAESAAAGGHDNSREGFVTIQSSVMLVRYTSDRQELLTCNRRDVFAWGADGTSLQLVARSAIVDGEPLAIRNLSIIL